MYVTDQALWKTCNADGSAGRVVGLAFLLVAAIFFLFQNLHPSHGFASPTTDSLHKIGAYVPSKWPSLKPPRITKVTSNVNSNDLFESAVATHEAQNDRHGYGLRVLRHRITDGWSSQAAYLLSIMITELEKPKKQRTQWLLWFQPDVVVLNPQIPLEVFLPQEPAFDDVHLLATHDDARELDNGVFFLRVNEWSARMLLEVLSMPSDTPGLQESGRKDRFALSEVIRGASYRDNVFYQPRNWYNAYAFSANTSEYRHGDMQLHFHGLGGDKWSGLSNTLNLLSSTPADFSVPLRKTTYRAEIDAYWERMQMARRVLKKAEAWVGQEGMEAKVQRLQYATNYEADKEKIMKEAIDGLRDAMGVSNGEHAI